MARIVAIERLRGRPACVRLHLAGGERIDLVVEVAEPTEQRTVRVFVAVQGESVLAEAAEAPGMAPARVYLRVDHVLQNEFARRQLLRQALRDLQAWQRKYETLTELAEVFGAIERATARLTAAPEG